MKQGNTSFWELRRFLILWASQMVSSLGSAMTSYALILWVYEQQGTATSVTLLSFFTYLPSVLFCFVAGTLADRWDKKKIMLLSDAFAALGTCCVFALYLTGELQIWHLYATNFVISFMNAFQNPAAHVAVSLIAPKDQYTRVSGLYAFSGSVVSILSPACATLLLAFGGLKSVFAADLGSFAIGFFTLLLFIHIPKIQAGGQKESFVQSCLVGLRFLRAHGALLRIIVFFSLINLLSYMTGYGILPAMILSRTGDNQAVLSMVSSSMGIGALVGSILATLMRPAKSRSRVIFAACGISFVLCDMVWGLGRSAWLWVPCTFFGNLPLPFLNANLGAIMRTNVPIELQGRVFSTRDTIQYATIPLGLFLGGFLADHAFEPFMRAASPVQAWLTPLFGSGKGSGMALMFLMTGIIGSALSFAGMRDTRYRELD